MRIRALVLSLACSFAALLAQAQSLIGHYEFNGNLNNSVTGGSALATLQSIGGQATAFTAEAGAWTWSGASTNPGIGLRLPTDTLELPYVAFSLGIVFKLSSVGAGGNWVKVIDFDNGTSDNGLYFYNGQMSAYGTFEGSTAGSFTANETITLVATRSIGGPIKFYVNGSTTPLINNSLISNSQFRIQNDANASLRFFVDNDDGDEFSPGGTVYEIRVWDGVLSSSQIPTAFAAIPEPSTYAAFGGLMALGFVLWHRRRNSAGKVQS